MHLNLSVLLTCRHRLGGQSVGLFLEAITNTKSKNIGAISGAEQTIGRRSVVQAAEIGPSLHSREDSIQLEHPVDRQTLGFALEVDLGSMKFDRLGQAEPACHIHLEHAVPRQRCSADEAEYVKLQVILYPKMPDDLAFHSVRAVLDSHPAWRETASASS